MLTNKTLKYSHSKTCGIVKQPPDTVTDMSAVRLCPNVIKQPNTINKFSLKPRSLSPPKETTLEEMRNNYYINAKQQRTQRIQSLFANAI